MLLAVFFIFIALLTVFILMPVYLELTFLRKSENDYLLFKIRPLAGLFTLSMKIDFIDLKEELGRLVIKYGESSKEDEKKGTSTGEIPLTGKEAGNVLRGIKALRRITSSGEALLLFFKDLITEGVKKGRLPHFLPVMTRLMKDIFSRLRITCLKLSWHTELGVNDPALTGFLAGMLWGVKGNVIALLNHKLLFKGEPVLMVTPCFNSSVFNINFEGIFVLSLGQIIKSFLWVIEDDIKRKVEKRWMSIPLKD